MIKGLWVYGPSPMFSKTCTFLYFYILSHLLSFWKSFPPPAHLPICLFIVLFFIFIFFSLSNHPNLVSTNLIRNLKPALICELSLSSGVFCSNPVLITTPISSLHFFCFFDELPSALSTTGMTLMNSFLFIRTISGFLALISLSHWIITSHKILTSSFSATPYRAYSYHFHFFSGCISHTISNELFLQHYRAFSCAPFVPTFHIHSQCEMLLYFPCHTFYRVVIGLFYLSCVSNKLFELLVLAQHTTWLLFQLSSRLFSDSTMFLFNLLFLAFLLQTAHTFFCFSIASSFPSSIFV